MFPCQQMDAKGHFSECSLAKEFHEFVEVKRCCRQLICFLDVGANVVYKFFA